MLSGLSIRDVVLIDRLDLELGHGLSVLTGETGAGKSIVLDALGLATGARADTGLIRSGAEQAVVAASFDVPSSHRSRALLKDQGIDTGDGGDPLVLRRTLGRDGRSRAYVNDQPVSVGLLRSLGDTLVEVHGQHDDRGLLNPSQHRSFLDAYGDLAGEVARVRESFASWQAARAEVDDFRDRRARAAAERDYLSHIVDELDALDPQPDEEEALASERTLLMHAEKIVEDLGAALSIVGGGGADDGVEGRISRALRRVERAAEKAGARFDALLEAIERASVEATEARSRLEESLQDLEHDPARLESIEERLFALRAAARKHNVGVDELKGLRERYRDQLGEIESAAGRLAELEEAAAQARVDYQSASERLSSARQKAAKRLDRAVARELGPLHLEKASFKTLVETVAVEAGGPDGLDRVVFQVSTIPGAPLGDLLKIASGGELSRFILAIKVVLARAGSAPTLIFDEVDRGVGGAVANAVGERLSRLANDAQIIVVTHSPQVAARADHHWRIAKQASEGDAKDGFITIVEPLDPRLRREEIARMLSGARISDEARAAADRLIEGAA